MKQAPVLRPNKLHFSLFELKIRFYHILFLFFGGINEKQHFIGDQLNFNAKCHQKVNMVNDCH